MKRKIFLAVLVAFLFLTGCTQEVKDKKVTITFNNQEIEGIFTGTVIDGIVSGEGEFKVFGDEGGWQYSGTFEQNAIAGNGKLENYTYKITLPSNLIDVTYNGECLNGLPNGNGSIQGKIENVLFEYIGEFENGNISGEGNVTNYPHTLSYENNDLEGFYTGELKDGTITGNGKFTDSSDDIEFCYEGEWLNGKMSGIGKLVCDKYIVHFDAVDRMGQYNGATLNGIADGQGIFKAKNDDDVAYEYNGLWKNGLCNGYGEFIYEENSYGFLNNIGNFVDGEFVPTPSEFMQYYSSAKNVNFKVSEETKEYIDKYEKYFGENAIIDYPKDLIKDVSYEEYKKKSYAYPTLFIETELCKVENIWEYDRNTTASDTLTEIYCSLSNDLFSDFEVIYFGSLPDIYSGTKIRIIGIPVAYGSIDNLMGGQNPCMFLLASSIETY